jgi:hypothetical protein
MDMNKLLKTVPGGRLLLLGDRDLGFFGRVDPKTLISYGDLAEWAGIHPEKVHNRNGEWLKFFWRGKPLFISMLTTAYGVSFRELEERGLVDGSRIIHQIGGVNYRVRIPENEEWDHLISPLHVSDPTGQNLGCDYTDDDLGVGSGDGQASWVQGVYPIYPNCHYPHYRVCRGYSSVENGIAILSSDAHPNVGWRVVLEPVGLAQPTVGADLDHTPVDSRAVDDINWSQISTASLRKTLIRVESELKARNYSNQT